MNGDRVNIAVRPVPRIERQVNGAVAIKTSEVETLDQIDLTELAANNDAAVFLQGERERSVVDASTQTKCRVNAAVDVQSRNAIAGESAEHRETAGNDNTTVRLQDSGENITIGADTRIE